ncbi:hypothetical protein OIU79_026417 [Salix purpurea]|uniref:Uncharacterized protein n=1 Tax=Salix purpurea TaxID=77065 RepID=A0A9Q0VU79_SALPP|nr:hypothetical protein OIU79_026417 [Salix purpurea]
MDFNVSKSKHRKQRIKKKRERREDSDFARADHLTRLLREEMEKHEQGGKAGLVG